MPQYTFEALDPGGKQITGTLDAPSRRDAYHQIELRRLAPVQVVEKSASPETNGSSKMASSGKNISADSALEDTPRLSRARLIFFTSELADLLEAGLPVQQA